MAEGKCPICHQPVAETNRKEHLTTSGLHAILPDSDFMKVCMTLMELDEKIKNLETSKT